MNVLINAISIVEGGGLVVLKQLLNEMSVMAPHLKWYIAANPYTLSQLPESKSIIKIPYSWTRKTPLHLFYWYELELPRLVKQLKADICFSHTNFLSRRKLSCPSLLLVQHAGYFSEKFRELHLKWHNNRLSCFLWKQKNKWVHKSIKKTTVLTVQTHALAHRIMMQTGIQKDKTVVIPHGPGLLNILSKTVKEFPLHDTWRIGYITKFGVQKDFTTAFKAISLLKKSGVRVNLVLTLDKNTPEYSVVAQQIREYGIEDIIENHGEVVNHEEIKKLYESLHLFIFPSLCESFGFTLVEAMASGLPVIAADTDSNREVIGKAGGLFDAENENQLAAKIHQYIRNKDLYILASQNSLNRAADFCWKKTAETMLQIIHKLIKE